VYPAVLVYFISAAVIQHASRALMVQFSLLCNRAGRASVLCNFILVFFRVFCDLNTLHIMPVIFK
jgi:tellurite resistance protein TehA-like permease